MEKTSIILDMPMILCLFIAESEEELQRILDITSIRSKEIGLSLNVKKIVCIFVFKQKIIPECNLASKN